MDDSHVTQATICLRGEDVVLCWLCHKVCLLALPELMAVYFKYFPAARQVLQLATCSQLVVEFWFWMCCVLQKMNSWLGVVSCL